MLKQIEKKTLDFICSRHGLLVAFKKLASIVFAHKHSFFLFFFSKDASIISITRMFPCFSAPSIGIPQILRMSLSECPVQGGAQIFILGNNFSSCRVVLQEFTNGSFTPFEDSKVVWQREALIDTSIVTEVNRKNYAKIE